MATKYEDIFASFKDGITDPDLIEFSEELQMDNLTALLRHAVSRCRRVCKEVDFSEMDDLLQEFNCEIPYDVEEILVEWMTVFWLKPYLNNAENLRNTLNTKDFQFFSPANLLEKIRERYNEAYRLAKSLTNEYSYVHSDMAGFSL